MGYIKKQILKKELIMDLLNLMEKRHSVRAYSNEKVSKEMVDRIVKAGVLAPTACNFQPIKILVIKSDFKSSSSLICFKILSISLLVSSSLCC